MCLIAWNWDPESESPLLLLSNRDEFYARPALALHWWQGGQILAGKDLRAGGTWLGVDRRGRLAALTNYRMPINDQEARPTRGMLVTGFLQGDSDAGTYLATLAKSANSYNLFNLLLYDGKQMLGLESRHGKIVPLPAGIGGVSNADLDTAWPKLEQLKQALSERCIAGQTDLPDLLPLLQDSTQAPDPCLPQTGVPLEWERHLSATFVAAEHYGTRASSIVRLGNKRCDFLEQGFNVQGKLNSTRHFFSPKRSVSES
jgi:uncharacterized protein with NRDE domain